MASKHNLRHPRTGRFVPRSRLWRTQIRHLSTSWMHYADLLHSTPQRNLCMHVATEGALDEQQAIRRTLASTTLDHLVYGT